MTALQSMISGTDIRGRALGEDIQLTEEIAFRLGQAFAALLEENGKPAPLIYIGRDSRVSGPLLLHACAQGMASAGAQVTEVGLCTTPAMFMTLVTAPWNGDGAVMVTASHMPSVMNGFKMILPAGSLDLNQLKKVIALAESGRDLKKKGGSICQKDFLPAYCALLAERIRKGLSTGASAPLKGLHVVVDAGNGAGGFYAGFLRDMGADTEGSVFLEPDGTFPHHIPNPENPDAMKAVSEAVLAADADLGVIFDADCDRAAIVDRDGREINRNRLIALISEVLLEQQPGATIVTDSVTSSGLKSFLEAHGGKHFRYKRGYHNVIGQAKLLNEQGENCPLAIETSGHAALKENYFLDDGMYLVTVLICEAMKRKRDQQTLGSLIADLKEPVESKELRLKILAPDFRAAGQALIEELTAFAYTAPGWKVAPDNREGIRISFDFDGEQDSAWFLLRLSVHDPVMPLNMESDVAGGCLRIAGALLSFLEPWQDRIDLTVLKEYINKA